MAGKTRKSPYDWLTYKQPDGPVEDCVLNSWADYPLGKNPAPAFAMIQRLCIELRELRGRRKTAEDSHGLVISALVAFATGTS